jgi:hypothetical protein
MRSPYDIEVKLRSTTAPNMRRNASRLIQEFKSGKAATTDLFLGSENHLISLKLETVNRTENTFEGKLRKRTFLGDHMILEFMIKDISVSVKAMPDVEVTGGVASVHLSKEKLVVFPEETRKENHVREAGG